MALVGTVVSEESAASVAKARKMIHVHSTSDYSIIRYTVPAGRKFVGRMIGDNTSSYFKLFLGSNENILIGNYTSNSGKVMPLELLAGQTVGMSYSHLIGVESDE